MFCAQAQLPDDGSGALRAWRVRAGGAAELERPQAAVFFADDCFLVLYTYHAPTGDQSILYYWMVSRHLIGSEVLLAVNGNKLKYRYLPRGLTFL